LAWLCEIEDTQLDAWPDVRTGGAAAWPLAARAQQAGRVRRIGVFMNSAERDPQFQSQLAAFRQRGRDLGWIEGRNVHIDYRFALDGGGADQFPALAKELVALQPDVVLAHGTGITAALQRESRAIPIVFFSVSDPIGSGFIDSLARPGGNLTGFLTFEEGIVGKWLAIFKEAAPGITRAAFMVSPKEAPYDYFLRAAQTAASSLAVELVPAPVENAADIERTIESFARVREAGRSPGAVSDKIRDGREPQDRQGARPCHTPIDPAARRRGDRMMQRREFITLLGGAAAAWPFAARAQQRTMPVIGYLSSRTADLEAEMLVAVRRGLADVGYAEGRNVAIEFRFADGLYDRLSALMTDLTQRKVGVVVFAGFPRIEELVQQVRASPIPIVVSASVDPVGMGLVASMNRPGGNVTGVTSLVAELSGKQLGLLHDLVPKAATIAALIDPRQPSGETIVLRDARAAAATLGQKLLVLEASTADEIDAQLQGSTRNRRTQCS
jgi:ABC-type uncharacterized transport system substrate-binding protein